MQTLRHSKMIAIASHVGIVSVHLHRSAYIYILDAKWGAKAPHLARPSEFQNLNQELKLRNAQEQRPNAQQHQAKAEDFGFNVPKGVPSGVSWCVLARHGGEERSGTES